METMSTNKIKNCEGWDRIPQRIFVEGIEVLAAPLTNLFKKIYEQMLLPEQGLVAKINRVDLNWLNQSY